MSSHSEVPEVDELPHDLDKMYVLMKLSILYCQSSPYGHLCNTETAVFQTVFLALNIPNFIQSLPLECRHLGLPLWCFSGLTVLRVFINL